MQRGRERMEREKVPELNQVCVFVTPHEMYISSNSRVCDIAAHYCSCVFL